MLLAYTFTFHWPTIFFFVFLRMRLFNFSLSTMLLVFVTRDNLVFLLFLFFSLKEMKIFTQQRCCWENIWCRAKFFVSLLARITVFFFHFLYATREQLEKMCFIMRFSY